MESLVCLKKSLGRGDKQKNFGPDRANVIFNDLSGPSVEGFFDPFLPETNEQVSALKRDLTELRRYSEISLCSEGDGD